MVSFRNSVLGRLGDYSLVLSDTAGAAEAVAFVGGKMPWRGEASLVQNEGAPVLTLYNRLESRAFWYTVAAGVAGLGIGYFVGKR